MFRAFPPPQGSGRHSRVLSWEMARCHPGGAVTSQQVQREGQRWADRTGQSKRAKGAGSPDRKCSEAGWGRGGHRVPWAWHRAWLIGDAQMPPVAEAMLGNSVAVCRG